MRMAKNNKEMFKKAEYEKREKVRGEEERTN